MDKVFGKPQSFLKFNYGDIVNTNTGKKMDIIVRHKKSWPMLVGLGLIAAGAKILSVSSFKSGADTYLNEENRVLEKLDLFKD